MAVKRKSGGGGGGANWMDTYGDMVTLLLCFFVLLYSMSTISEEKFKALVQSFNPTSLQTSTDPEGTLGPLADPSEGIGSQYGLDEPENLAEDQEDIDALLAQLAEMLQQMADAAAAESGEASNIDVTKGDGYVFISFNDAVFFRGESAVIEPTGRAILDQVAEALNMAAPAIDELRIMGHTAQADPNVPNRVERDRTLSASRAANVVIYIQERVNISPARIVGMFYGQHRPVDSNATGTTRAHNRRVEMIVTGLDLYNQLGDSLQQYRTLRSGDASLSSGVPVLADGADAPESA